MERPVQPERVAHPHQGDARGAAQIAEHLSDELVELSFVDHEFLAGDGGAILGRGTRRPLAGFLRKGWSFP